MAWESGLRRLIAAAPERQERALDRLGALGQKVARARARVRSGRMRDRIDWESRVDQLEAGAPYTPYMEFGTRYVDAQPMLQPAADAMAARASEEFSDLFD